MTIYVLVEVDYDFDREQDNIFASENIEEVRSFIKQYKPNSPWYKKFKTYTYDKTDYDFKYLLKDKNEAHFWIQKLKGE